MSIIDRVIKKMKKEKLSKLTFRPSATLYYGSWYKLRKKNDI